MDCYLTYFLIILLSSVAFLVIYINWLLSYWKRKRIPHLTPTFLFGNYENPITTRINIHHCFMYLYRRLKEMGIRSGGIYIYTAPFLLVVDPVDIKQVLLKDFQNFQHRGLYSNEKCQPVSLNLVTAEGQKWRNLRTKLTPTFTSAKIKLMFDLMVEVSKSMENFFHESASKKIPLNAKDCARYFATDIIGTCAFGLDCNSFRDNAFDEIIAKLLKATTNFAKISLLLAFPKIAHLLGVPLLETKGTEYFCNMLDEAVKRRRESASVRKDFLQILLGLRDDCAITDTEIKAQCLLFFLAGHETVSATMTFILFELALHQDIQDKLRNEINQILDANNGITTYETVINMRYLEMVICEVLRKYPTIPILNRICVNDVALPDTNFTIEKNTNIVISVIGLHNDPAYYPNPDEFDPERFSEENKENIVPYTYIPFGEGPRSCIGERFSKQELKVGIIAVIRKYRIKVNPMVKLPLKLASSMTTKSETDILLDVEAIC